MNRHARCAAAFAALALALLATGCTPRAPEKPQPLPTVSPLPAPAAHAPVASVAPTGEAGTLAQIRVRFSDDLIPLERLESPDETAVLAHFSVDPALPGRFRFLTPRMIGFEADRAWPPATRVRVTVTKGVQDVHGHELADDLAWTFQTPAIDIGDLPSHAEYQQPRDLHPKIELTSNVALDRPSLQSHAFARAHDEPQSQAIALVIPPDTATASPSAAIPDAQQPGADFDPSQRTWRYLLVPAHDLEKGKQYDITIEPGVLPRDGNRASEKAFSGQFRTYDVLRFTGPKALPGFRLTNGDPSLQFTTPIDEKSLKALALSPAPARGTTPFAVTDGGVAVNTALLQPQTDYTVTIGAGLRDTFGQTLGTAQTSSFHTGDFGSDVWAPSGLNLFPAGRDVRLNVVAVNAPPDVRAVFRALKPEDAVLYSEANGNDRGDMLPLRGLWPRFDAHAPKNAQRTIEIPLRAKLGAPAGALAYGVYADLPRDKEPFVAAGVVQLTDLGVFAQWFPGGGVVRVNRIADGTPAAGARADVYVSQADAESKSAPVPCASATTDASGTARFGGAGFVRCALHAATSTTEEQAPSLVTVVRKSADWTYVRTSDNTGVYSGNFYNSWNEAVPLSRGTIFSDRQLYKPGETAQLTGVGWFLIDGVLRRGTAASYALTLQLPSGDKRDLGRRALNEFGTFSIPVVLAKDAQVGYYTLTASAGNGEQIDGNFRVAEFKPPNFKVDLALDRAVARPGGTVTGTASNDYLFGAPLTGASTKFTVTRSNTTFTPKGRDAFSFGRQWFWPEQPPTASTDVLEKTVTVDANGKSAVAVPVASDLPFPMTYEVDSETTDASNIAVADSKQFTALPSDTLIGVKTDDVGTAGTPLGISVIATDPSGKARAGTNVHVELQLATFNSATQIVEGAEQPVQSVSYATVASTDTASADKPVSVSLKPTKPGTYRVRANAAGASDAAETDVEVFIGGSGETAWYMPDPNLLTVKLDKATYKPGETATALVQSPFPNADLHLAVVRHGVLWETTQQTSSAAPTVRFTVTPQMLPNAVVEAFLVRRGAPPAKNAADTGNALARPGFVAFNVALDAKYVVPAVRAVAGTLAPGAQQTVRVHLADGAKQPVHGQVTLMVVNDAVLRLTGYRPPDLVKLVYADQPISTRFADNRAALVLNTLQRPVEKGWGFGGGLSGEEADPRVRHNFQPLAYFAGALRTDANGDASATFTLPDDLTTWRVMVVSATADGRFGNGEASFRTTKPLIANPVVPQFARPGDTFDAGVSVTNGTGASGTLHVDAVLAGPLAFLVNDKPVASTSLDAPLDRITKAYRFPVVANGTGTATATVKVRGASAGDAFAIPVPVRALDVSESVAQTGTTDANAQVGLDVAAGTPRDAGGVDVSLASSLIPEIVVAAKDALRGDERIAITSAARLAVASDLATLAKRNGTDARAARDRALLELATLSNLQRGDGGFAPYWRDDRADPWDSLFVLKALARAHDAGIAVAPSLYAGARRYAAAVLGDPTAHAKWCTSDLCKSQLRLRALDALAAAGDRRSTFLSDVDAQRDKLSFADQARLARLLTLAPGYTSQAATLAKTIEDHLYATARGAVVNLPDRYGWYDAPVVAQSEALRLELARNADGETLDRLTRSLLDMRRNGTFGCACENAAALGALVDLAAREKPASFTATATLAGKTIAQQRFSGPRAPQRDATVAMRDLPAGKSQLSLAKAGTGTLHYAVTYTYRLGGAAPGRLSGMRVTRVVREANTAPVLATMGLTAPTSSLTLPAAHVYDVELQIVSDHLVERVLISDPLPAGFEAVDTSFATSSHALQLPSSSWSLGDQQIHPDRIEAYADRLDAGIYRLHYLVRTVTPGTFAWPGAEAHVLARPDEFGRSATSLVVVR